MAILNQEGFCAACFGPQADPEQFVIPEKYVALGRPNRACNPFGEIWAQT
jgi:hypothetical protein